jgi:hypothetical protein
MKIRAWRFMRLAILFTVGVTVSLGAFYIFRLMQDYIADRSTAPTPQLLIWNKPPSRQGNPSQQEWLQWAERWLDQQPCRVPCWEGITPGQTTVAQAIQQLQSLSFVDPASIAVQRWSCGNGQELPGGRRLAWRWITGELGGSAVYEPKAANLRLPSGCGDAFTVEEVPLDTEIAAQRIISIEPSYDTPLARLPANRNRVKLTFGDVRAAFGEPSHVLVVSNYGDGWHTINIVYEQQGIVLFWTGLVPQAITDELTFRRMVFSSIPVQDAGEEFPYVPIQQWQAGRDSAFYCRRETGELCT